MEKWTALKKEKKEKHKDYKLLQDTITGTSVEYFQKMINPLTLGTCFVNYSFVLFVLIMVINLKTFFK